MVAAVSGRVALGDHSHPVADAEVDDGAVAGSVDAVLVGRRAVDAEHADVVAFDRQTKGAVGLRSGAHVHIVTAGRRHRHLHTQWRITIFRDLGRDKLPA